MAAFKTLRPTRGKEAMKNLLITFALCSFAAVAFAVPNTPISLKWPAAEAILILELHRWAELLQTDSPPAICGSAIPAQQCCDPTKAGASQCTQLVRDVVSGGADFVASGLVNCLVQGNVFRGDTYVENGQLKGDFQTFPGIVQDGTFIGSPNLTTSDGARLSEVARCASSLAASRYPII